MINLKSNLILLSIILFVLQGRITAQPYLYIADSNGGPYTFGYFNLATCEYCIDFTIPNSSSVELIRAVLPMPTGEVVTVTQDGIINVYQPPSSIPTSTFNVSGIITSAVLSPNGNIYFIRANFAGGNYESCLYEFDLITGAETLIGCVNNFILIDIFFLNGTLYSFGYEGPPPNQNYGLFSIGIGNPLTITTEETYPFILCGGNTAVIPGFGIYTTTVDPDCNGNVLFNFDLPSNSTTIECEDPFLCFCYGISDLPSGFPPPPASCICTTEAGEVSSTNNLLCVGEDFTFTNSGSELDSDDALEYILFTDLTDTLGSILLTSSSPSFSFSNPPLQTGMTYYVAAIAGNELPGGGVDLTDICLDISNAIEVLWNPLPTVAFAVTMPDVCQGGCTNIEVTFTGIPPFSLTYDTPGNIGQTANFSSNTGTFTVCVPENALPGSFNLQATALSDAHCLCD